MINPCIIGLGYVGLPLLINLSKKYKVIGYDNNQNRIENLKSGIDIYGEFKARELKNKNIYYSNSLKDIKNCNLYIITVPTPIFKNKQPDLRSLKDVCQKLSKIIKSKDIIIFESTVYPGLTNDFCIPLIEKNNNLKEGKDFFVGYSPERINPGDKEHRITNIKKITSGSTPLIANLIDDLYKDIISAGTHKAKSIKVAEAAKVIENTQRDLNIALVNELAIIFNKMDIDTQEVLEAAGTKWNFLPFRPGIVGGHCIGVDPYYLTHKAQSIGYKPEIILAGRRMNDGMSKYISSRLIKAMKKKAIDVYKSRILIMGLTFKENCPDLRNTKVMDIIYDLEGYGSQVEVYDPWVDSNIAKNEYKIKMVDEPKSNKYDAIVIAVAHNKFKELGAKKISSFATKINVIYDLKYLFEKEYSSLRL